MHPYLEQIAERHGIPLSDRSCYNDYMWNGRDLARMFQSEIYDKEYVEFSVSAPKPIHDFQMAHELAHWVVADPVEREFPEYGCELGIVGFGAYPWGSISNPSERDRLLNVAPGVLLPDEQLFREICADFLGQFWCDCAGLITPKEWRISYKIASKSPGYTFQDGHRAVLHLTKMGLLG